VPDPCALTATDIAAAVRARDVSREEVLAAHLDRVEALDGDVGAFVEPVARDAALARARRADRDAAQRTGLPLDGVPVSLKDHFDVEGMVRTDGVRAFAQRRSPGTSVAVQRLIDAGAAVVGKTNQPDFKVRWNTISDVRGATRNPRDLSLSAGGSSGGDAAAVAAGMAAAGLGTDLGGSIRVPASFCGVWGLRTTPGQVPDVRLVEPRHPTPAAALFSSVGVLARSVADLELVFDAVRGPHPADPLSVAATAAGAAGPGPRRVARMCTQAGATVTPEIEARLDRTCALLAAAGYEVVDAAMPAAERLPELWGALAGTEMKRVALPRWRAVMGESGLQHAEELFGLFELEDGVGAVRPGDGRAPRARRRDRGVDGAPSARGRARRRHGGAADRLRRPPPHRRGARALRPDAQRAVGEPPRPAGGRAAQRHPAHRTPLPRGRRARGRGSDRPGAEAGQDRRRRSCLIYSDASQAPAQSHRAKPAARFS
jgi:amidase